MPKCSTQGELVLPSREGSFARKQLPFVLSIVAGSVDVIGFLALDGLFTAHITGNSLGGYLALRLAERGARLVYVPAAEFLHARGASVPELGYAQFLLFYARNLVRYGEKHHGRAAARALRAALAAGALLRLALLPLRAARRTASRGDAARALLALAGAAARGFPRAETAA